MCGSGRRTMQIFRIALVASDEPTDAAALRSLFGQSKSGSGVFFPIVVFFIRGSCSLPAVYYVWQIKFNISTCFAVPR